MNIATPIFMATMLINFPYHYLVSLVLFIAASLTDMIDGKMARKYNLVTDFGKFLDPLADKMLTTSAYLGFICMFVDKYGYCWQMTAITFVVLFREFMVSSIRLVVVSSGGKVIAANIWGKLKTVSQMAGIILALFAYTLIKDFGITSIENIADKMEENNISCYSYSYFIYSYLEYFKLIDVSENFSKIKFVPFKWVNPKYFDYSDLSKTFGEDISIGFGRKVTTLDDFIINGNVLKKYTGKSSYVIIPNTIEKIDSNAE